MQHYLSLELCWKVRFTKSVERKPNVRELANFIDRKEREARPQREWLIEKAGAVVNYNTMYHIYSQVAHWTLKGMHIGQQDRDIVMAFIALESGVESLQVIQQVLTINMALNSMMNCVF